MYIYWSLLKVFKKDWHRLLLAGIIIIEMISAVGPVVPHTALAGSPLSSPEDTWLPHVEKSGVILVAAKKTPRPTATPDTPRPPRSGLRHQRKTCHRH